MSRAADSVAAALQALSKGKLVIVPTETVYGLAVDAANRDAVAALFVAKGRPASNPLIAHVADLEAAERVGRFDRVALALAEAFWPGPLTLVVPIRSETEICLQARAGLETVALRAPTHPVFRDVLSAFGRPLAAPSANRSGRPSPTTLAHALEETGRAAAVSLEGGPCRIGLESTVIACLDGLVRLLRPGGLERDRIEAISGPLLASGGEGGRSPGRMLVHYAPQAPVRLNAQSPDEGEAYLAFGPGAHVGPGVWNLSPAGEVGEAAANLFAYLRQADQARPRRIAVAPIPDHGLGEAINDRLRRAAGLVG